MSIIDAALNRSRTAVAALVMLLATGVVAFITIPKESDPDINIPIIYVSLNHDGISPEDSERLLVRPVETELRSIEGVKEMRSTAYQGGANVLLEFDAGFDADQALLDVREQVDIAKPELPDDTDEPTVNEVNLSQFPVLIVTLSGAVSERTLMRLARHTRDEIEGIPSVLDVNIGGDRDELVEIIIDPALIDVYGLDATELLSQLSRSNLLVAAGALNAEFGQFAVKVPGLFENVQDILAMPVKVEGDSVIALSDIATIRRTFKDRDTYARVNGQPALTLEVSKRSGENIIDTIAKVRDVVEAERLEFPPGVIVKYSQDRSSDIRTMLGDLQNNVISAVLLVMIVIVGALGLRSGILVGIAIPGSFLSGILVLQILGLTVNIVVLFSLILAVGMLVDGAIVVTEYADRKLREGEPPKVAYALAAKRMSWPIIASTATTLAAFAPLLFWPGIVGEFMKFLPITLVATLSASLLMALVFVPVLGANLAGITYGLLTVAGIGLGVGVFSIIGNLVASAVGLSDGPSVSLIVVVATVFGALVSASLLPSRHGWRRVLGVAAASGGLLGTIVAFLSTLLGLPSEPAISIVAIFFGVVGAALGFWLGNLVGRAARNVLNRPPAVAGNNLTASGDTDPRSVTGATGLYVRLLDTALKRPAFVLVMAFTVLGVSWGVYAFFGRGVEFFPEVEPDLAKVQIHARGNLSVDEKNRLVGEVEEQVLLINDERGEFDSVYTLTGNLENNDDVAEDIVGTIDLEFADWQLRRPADDILAEIKDRTRHLGGILVETTKAEGGPPVGKPVQVQLGATDPTLLAPEIAKVRAFFDGMEGLKDIEDSRPLPGIEWELNVDRAQAAKFGADIALIGNIVRLITNGLTVTDFRPNDSDDEIDIAVRFPQDKRTIDQLDRIRLTTTEGLVPLSNFVTRTAIPRTGLLRRVDSDRVMTVKADVEPGVLVDAKVQEIRAWLPSADIDPRVTVTFKGEDEEQKAAQAFLMKAFVVALFIMAIILVTQFNSFYSAVLILSAVILSTVGVMLGLLAIGQPFGIVMSGIGVIALAGIVVNNNIVLIDTFDRLNAQIGDARRAILLTGAQRLRPVLLTSVTTILGLMPMVLQLNIDFASRAVSQGAPSTQWWVQLATAIVFGLAFATILTLIVTPSALMFRANIQAWLRRRAAKRAAKQAKPSADSAPAPSAAE